MALPEHPAGPASAARAIPIDLQHVPSPRKPSRRADAQQWQNWRLASAAFTISRRGAQRLTHLRQAIDQNSFRAGMLRTVAQSFLTDLVYAGLVFLRQGIGDVFLDDIHCQTTALGNLPCCGG